MKKSNKYFYQGIVILFGTSLAAIIFFVEPIIGSNQTVIIAMRMITISLGLLGLGLSIHSLTLSAIYQVREEEKERK
jgi:hypothetical protein